MLERYLDPLQRQSLLLWERILAAAVVLVGMYLVYRLVLVLFDGLARRRFRVIAARKQATILSVLHAVMRFILGFIAISWALQFFGIRAASVIAAAGIGGVALAFGAQSIIADVITGLFILVEDQVDVGDWVVVGSIEGTVKAIGLRRMVVEGYSGVIHSIPNSQVKIISNFQRQPIRADITVEVPYTCTPERLEQLIMRLTERCAKKHEVEFTIPPYFIGVAELGVWSYRATIGAQTKAGDQWMNARVLRRMLLDLMLEEGVLPHSQQMGAPHA